MRSSSPIVRRVGEYFSRRELFAGVLWFAAASVGRAQTDLGSPSRTSRWWPQVDLIGASLENGRWKYARKRAIRLTETILEESWRDRELDEVLAELALYRAVANANLDRREDAVWYWQMALNLNRRVAERDLSAYGVAATSLSEIPLRKMGSIPSRFLEGEPGPSALVSPPEFPKVAPPILINNAGGSQQRSADFEVEVVVDDRGGIHHPVVLSRHANPVVIYACLDWLREVPALTPARLGGQAVPTTLALLIELKISDYSGAAVLNEVEPD